MTPRGFSLLELVLGCALLSLVTFVIFFSLNYGFRSFTLASARSGLQGELRSLAARLHYDATLSTMSGPQIASLGRTLSTTTDGGTSAQPRHLLCLPGKRNWNDDGSFEPGSGLPIWDEYIVYHADLERQGSLSRVTVRPADPFQGGGWLGFSNYLATYRNLAPVTGAPVGGGTVQSVRRLSRDLLGFQASKSSSGLAVLVRLVSRTRRDEILEAVLQIQPRNRAY